MERPIRNIQQQVPSNNHTSPFPTCSLTGDPKFVNLINT